MWHSRLNDTEIPETKRFIARGFELGATLSWPHWSIAIKSYKSYFLTMIRVQFLEKNAYDTVELNIKIARF